MEYTQFDSSYHSDVDVDNMFIACMIKHERNQHVKKTNVCEV